MLMPLSSVLRRTGLLALALLASSVHAQSAAGGFWSDLPAAAAARLSVPAAYRALSLDRPAMAARLAGAPLAPVGGSTDGGVAVPVPVPGGDVLWFRVVESPVMAAALQARYPEIRTYVGQGIDVPAATVRISLTPAGFAAQAFTPGGALYVDATDAAPAAGTQPDYVAYFSRDQVLTAEQQAARRNERLDDAATGDVPPVQGADALLPSNGTTYRTYRLAIAATGEYTARFGGTVAQGLAAQVVAVNRVNQVYERDLSVHLEIVATNDQIVFTDAATDPYSSTDAGTLYGENQTVIDSRIGAANYDIGHVFSTSDGGVAGLGVVCTGSKALGVTGLPNPTGDAFYIDYVAHEMGHQFRGDHTFNGTGGSCGGGNRSGSAAYEPGSGSTIMAYAGICGTANNLQNNSDPYFHTFSLQQIAGFITNGAGSTCGTAVPTGNDIPVVTAPSGSVIPISTPFTLTGAATDATPAALTYTWEEFDIGTAGNPAANGVPTTAPFFRSFNPTPSPSRTFPQMSRLLAGTPPVRGEGLPNTAQFLRFRLTARDNRASGGAYSDVTVVVSTDAGAGPFVVTAPAGTGLTFGGGSTQSVTWNVANTDVLDDAGAPDADGVDVENVQILYSTDGGLTFTTLLASTPNDGQADVTIPVGATTQGRILVAAVGNVFFNLAPATFTVTPGTPDEAGAASAAVGLSAVAPNPATGRASLSLRQAAPGAVTVGVYDALGRRVAVLFDGVAGTDEALSLDVAGLPAGVYVVRASGAGVQAAQRFTVVR